RQLHGDGGAAVVLQGGGGEFGGLVGRAVGEDGLDVEDGLLGGGLLLHAPLHLVDLDVHLLGVLDGAGGLEGGEGVGEVAVSHEVDGVEQGGVVLLLLAQVRGSQGGQRGGGGEGLADDGRAVLVGGAHESVFGLALVRGGIDLLIHLHHGRRRRVFLGADQQPPRGGGGGRTKQTGRHEEFSSPAEWERR